jgi:predicted nucleotidyltransferase
LHKHQKVLRQLGVRKIGVFGSYAKSRETKKSDIDFLVEFDEPSFDRFMALIEFLEKLFGKKVDVLTREGVETIRARNVAEDIQRNTVYV